jgi:hypothetical protein
MEAKKEWLTPNELRDEYDFSISTQAKYRMNRKIPFSKVGKYIRYSRTAINAWLEENQVQPA